MNASDSQRIIVGPGISMTLMDGPQVSFGVDASQPVVKLFVSSFIDIRRVS